MGRIFCIIGKSGTGKDTLLSNLLKKRKLLPIIPYTTRPKRENEVDGVEYNFVSYDDFLKMKENNEILEYRRYDTVMGPWYYFNRFIDITLDINYVLIGTIQLCRSLYEFYGKDNVNIIYLFVDDYERINRSLNREKANGNISEICRRYLSDEKDYSKEELASLDTYFSVENIDLEKSIEKIIGYIDEASNAVY